MDFQVTPQLEEWIRQDVKNITDAVNKKKYTMGSFFGIILGSVIICVICMLAIGLKFDAKFETVIYVLLPIGFVAGILVGLIVAITQRSGRKGKKTLAAYQKAAKNEFEYGTEQDQQIFCQQMMERNYTTVTWVQKDTKLCSSVMIGPRYWFYTTTDSAVFVNVAEIVYVYAGVAGTSAPYHLKQEGALGIGVKMYIACKFKGNEYQKGFTFESDEKLREIVDLIHTYCPSVKVDI